MTETTVKTDPPAQPAHVPDHGHDQGHVHDENCSHGHDHHQHASVTTLRRASPKVGRNDPCPCGSGKKHKKCCQA